MKLLPVLLCAAVVAFVLPACATPKKKETASCCSSGGKCDSGMKKHKH